MTGDDWDLTINAVRNMIRQCNGLEMDCKRDLAFQSMFGTPVEVARAKADLVLASQSTAQYVGLLARLTARRSREVAAR